MQTLPALGPILKTALTTAVLNQKEIDVMDIVYHNHRNYKSMQLKLKQLIQLIEMLSANVPMPCMEIVCAQMTLMKLFEKMRTSYYY